MITLIVDPGHGGSDTGTTAGGLIEKYMNISIAVRFTHLIESYYRDIEVILTRNSDIDVPLAERVEIANRNPNNPIFVSFHHNASSNPSVRGTEIYVFGPDSWKISTGSADPESFEFAKKLQEPINRHVCKYFGFPFRGIYDGDFEVLRKCKGTGVLLETFYATNADDLRVASHPDFSFEVANAYAKAFADALGLRQKGIFVDVEPESWYAKAVERMYHTELMFGSEGKFRPNEPITRAELAVVLSRLLDNLQEQ